MNKLNFDKPREGIYLTLVNGHGDADAFTQHRVRFENTPEGEAAVSKLLDAIEILCWSRRSLTLKEACEWVSERMVRTAPKDLHEPLGLLICTDVTNSDLSAHPVACVVERIDSFGTLNVAKFQDAAGMQRPYRMLVADLAYAHKLRDLGFEIPEGERSSSRERWLEVGSAGEYTFWVAREEDARGTPILGRKDHVHNLYQVTKGATPPTPGSGGYSSLKTLAQIKGVDIRSIVKTPQSIPDGWICASSQTKDWKPDSLYEVTMGDFEKGFVSYHMTIQEAPDGTFVGWHGSTRLKSETPLRTAVDAAEALHSYWMGLMDQSRLTSQAYDAKYGKPTAQTYDRPR